MISKEEAKSCIRTIEMLRTLAMNVHGVIDAVDDANCKKTVEMLKEQAEIVRCKDCIWWDKGHTEECDNSDSVCFHNGWCKPDWFCADGEKRRNEDV